MNSLHRWVTYFSTLLERSLCLRVRSKASPPVSAPPMREERSEAIVGWLAVYFESGIPCDPPTSTCDLPTFACDPPASASYSDAPDDTLTAVPGSDALQLTSSESVFEEPVNDLYTAKEELAREQEATIKEVQEAEAGGSQANVGGSQVEVGGSQGIPHSKYTASQPTIASDRSSLMGGVDAGGDALERTLKHKLRSSNVEKYVTQRWRLFMRCLRQE
ncbi:hypothetical protein CYMTET_37883 [Cymbomonas tetramitiformis]|uniref:Uncharacterized protein n=1 Tax=Cymbomonas tetramitiformis TaxID=36881 RepID=A0AAE0CEL5_9CHLO|nr:hypothetical protein CYMTET_37883 [Cymbomonas tetramitiformis]